MKSSIKGLGAEKKTKLKTKKSLDKNTLLMTKYR